ncbi:MAG: hypothetical protein RJR34_05510 [Candidatus Methanoculleus thermohydrogenotrophicum]|nr:hypothetical protein [Candidatus Methanoculleus thermohydrogenotrophicum]
MAVGERATGRCTGDAVAVMTMAASSGHVGVARPARIAMYGYRHRHPRPPGTPGYPARSFR